MYEQLRHYILNQINVSEDDLNVILPCFIPLKPKKNELLVTQGQTSHGTFFVNKGCLRIFFIDGEGQEATRYFAFEDQFATALVSFITGEPSEELIQAVEPSDLLYISHDDFYRLLDVIPQWEKFYRYYLEKAYVNNTRRLKSFLIQDATEKYRLLLEQDPIIVQRLSNKMVASYLNISQETLSRLKSKV